MHLVVALLVASFLLLARLSGISADKQQFSMLTSDPPEARVRACAKCIYYDGSLPFNLQNQLRQMPNDPRCQYWVDNIPTRDYEDCGTPSTGESNACVYLNFTVIMQNAVTNSLGQAAETAASISDFGSNATNVISNPVSSLTNATNGAIPSEMLNNFGTGQTGGSSPGNNASILASLMQVVPTGGRTIFGKKTITGTNNNGRVLVRPKRQMMIGGDNYPGFLASNTGGVRGGSSSSSSSSNMNSFNNVLNPAAAARASSSQSSSFLTQPLSPVNNVLNTGSSFGGSSNNGAATMKIYYKGCARISLLETLAGSHCKLQAELADIRFFSQQALLQPMMDAINSMDQLFGSTGSTTTVDGLCYFLNKEFARQLWTTFGKLSPVSGGSGGIASSLPMSAASSLLPTLFGGK